MDNEVLTLAQLCDVLTAPGKLPPSRSEWLAAIQDNADKITTLRQELAHAKAELALLRGSDNDQDQPKECERSWVEYVQPIYKSVAAGDVLWPNESAVKRYENLGFMCDICGKVKPPTDPATREAAE